MPSVPTSTGTEAKGLSVSHRKLGSTVSTVKKLQGEVPSGGPIRGLDRERGTESDHYSWKAWYDRT